MPTRVPEYVVTPTFYTADGDRIAIGDTVETEHPGWQTVTIAGYEPANTVHISGVTDDIEELKQEIEQLKSDNQKLLAMFDKLTAKEVAELMEN